MNPQNPITSRPKVDLINLVIGKYYNVESKQREKSKAPQALIRDKFYGIEWWKHPGIIANRCHGFR